MPRVTVLAGGVGGARFVRGAARRRRPRTRSRSSATSATTSSTGASRSRPTSTRCSTRSRAASTPSRAGASPATRARRWPSSPSSAAATGSSSATATSACTSCAASACARASRSRRSRADFARRYGLGARLLPATDDRLRTRIVTADGELAFQEWLVGRRAADPVSAVRFEGVPGARPGARRARGDRERGRDRARALQPVRLARPDPRRRRRARRRRGAPRARRRDHADDRLAGRQGPARGDARDARPRRLGASAWQACSPRSPPRSCSTARTRRCSGEIQALGPAHGLRADADARRRRAPPRSPAPRSPRAVSDYAVTGLRGLPELRAGDDLAGAARGRRRALRRRPARRRRRLRRAEGRLQGRGPHRRPRGRAARPQRALEIAGDDGDPRMLELILGESARIVRRRGSFLVCETHHGFVCAAAGVDRSNTGGGDSAVLLPVDPDASARRAARRVRRDGRGRRDHHRLVRAAVPARHDRRRVGCAGLAPLRVHTGERDDAGRVLQGTELNAADQIASAAELVMGPFGGVPARARARPRRRALGRGRPGRPDAGRARPLPGIPRTLEGTQPRGHDSQRQGQGSLRPARRSACSAS